MKKVFLLATAAFLFTGFAFAHQDDGKKCAKGKDCCSKDCKKDDKKDIKATKTTAKVTTKPAAAKA